jgi:competence ComEA-like helix-hairpin-helix protein
MRRIKAWIRLVFGFSQTETNAFITLLPLMLIIIISEPVYQTYIVSSKPDNLRDRQTLDSLIAALHWDDTLKVKDFEKKELFVKETIRLTKFDPNTATEQAFISLGISKRVASGIIKYRSKGGKFRIRKDFRKVYGLDSSLFTSLEPYIQLPENYARDSSTFVSRKPGNKVNPIFDLNLADTIQLASVYGIGPSTARRIVKYRAALGGFLDHEQLFEVWGIDSTVVRRLAEKSVIAAGFMPNRLAINQRTEEELGRHPYLRTKLARAIVNYRFQHGKFATVDDLKKIAVIDEKAFLRIKPYITLE